MTNTLPSVLALKVAIGCKSCTAESFNIIVIYRNNRLLSKQAGTTSVYLSNANTHTHCSTRLTVTIRPISWKYLTRGMVFCLKLVRRRSMALGLSSGRPCCSARFCSLSFKRWLVQARKTTRSGVQIYRERKTCEALQRHIPLRFAFIHM